MSQSARRIVLSFSRRTVRLRKSTFDHGSSPARVDRSNTGYIAHDDMSIRASQGFNAENNPKKTLLLSHSLRFAAEKYSGAFERFVFREAKAQKSIDIYASHRLLYLRELWCYTCLPAVRYRHSANRENVCKSPVSGSNCSA
jgi:hypothetical protein